MRVNELVAGVKADVAVLMYGDDLNVLDQKGKEIEAVLRRIRGSADVKSSLQANMPTLRIEPRREALALYGIDAARVMDAVSAIGGREVGQMFDPQGRARFPIRVRIPEAWRTSPSMLEQMPVGEVGGQTGAAGASGRRQLRGDARYRRARIGPPPGLRFDNGARSRRGQLRRRGRAGDQASVSLPPHYEIRWGGTFQNLQSASLRLALITPMVLVVILLLLYTTFGSMRLAVLIFLAVPIAASGGVFALALRGMPFSISAGVGFIALFGVAVLNGLVWVTAAERARQSGAEFRQAAAKRPWCDCGRC